MRPSTTPNCTSARPFEAVRSRCDGVAGRAPLPAVQGIVNTHFPYLPIIVSVQQRTEDVEALFDRCMGTISPGRWLARCRSGLSRDCADWPVRPLSHRYH